MREPADRRTRERRRALGIVYTPSTIARPMVARALVPLVAGATARELRALRVCDPAMGDGAFLLEVIDLLATRVVGARGDLAAARKAIAEQCVYGVDLDAAAVRAARKHIAAATGADPDRLAAALRVGDALAGVVWPDEFADVWRARGGFDAVVGNPPYVRQERVSAATKATLRTYATYDGVADLYVYFVELAHRLVRAGGRYCLIVPNKWMSAEYGRALRTYWAAQRSLEGIVDFGRAPRMFPGADAFPCIAWGTVGGELAATEIIARDARADVTAGLAAVADVSAGDVGDTGSHARVARTQWRAEPWHIDRDDDAALIAELERTLPALADVVDGRPARGVVTGCNAAFVIDRDTRDRLLDREPHAAALVRPLVKGRDLRAWRVATAERWILLIDRGTTLDALPHVAAHLAKFRARLEPRPADRVGAWRGRKPGAYRWFELQDPVGALAASRAPKLLIQDIQSAACCCAADGDLVADTTVWMLPTANPLVLAILNSPLYWWYARRRFPPALGGAVRPKLDYLRRFPVADPPPALRAHIAALVARRLAAPDADRGALDRALAIAVFEAYGIAPRDRARLGAARASTIPESE